jgi:hypothetical protein
MIQGIGLDLVLVGLTSVAVAADRALRGSSSTRHLLLATTFFAISLVLDLGLSLGNDVPSAVRAMFALAGLIVYIFGGVAVIVSFIDHLTRGYGSGGGHGRPAWGHLTN